jgi:regulatory factor X
MYAAQWMSGAAGHTKDMNGTPQLSPEDMILQAATHMQASGQDFTMDASMGAHMGHAMSFQHHDGLPRHPLPTDQYPGNGSFTEGDSQMMDRDDNDEGDSMAALAGPAKSSSARSSANNELEMRQLFGANRHRTLQDVAGELHGNERGPNSERTRQVFAMLW